MIKVRCLGVEFEPLDTGALVDGKAHDNMIEAWTIFINRVDSIGRRRIGDYLVTQGCDRHTGERGSYQNEAVG